MTLRRLAYSVSTAILGVSSLFVLISPAAHAANVTWDGGGGDNLFSNAVNWSADTLPVAGDVLVFDETSLVADTVINNDLTGFSAGGISTTGSNSGYKHYTITGNSMDVAGTIDSSSYTKLFLNIVLSADVTLSGTSALVLGDYTAVTPNNVSLNGHNLTVSAPASIYSVISGSGNITVTNNNTLTLIQSNTFTGNILVDGTTNSTSIIIKNATSLGNVSNLVTINGALGNVAFCNLNGGSVANPITVNDGSGGAVFFMGTTCSQMGGVTAQLDPMASVNLTGTVTLLQNAKVSGVGELTISGPLHGNFTVTMNSGQLGKLTVASSDNQSLTPNGSQSSAVTVTEISDKQPLVSVYVSPNEVVIINAGAERGDITLSGGTLKGVGSVGDITMNSGAVAPGMSPGVLNTGSLSMSGGAVDIEIGGTAAGSFDQLNVVGTVAFTGGVALNVSHWNNFRPAVGNTFVIINNDGVDAVTSTFTGLAQGATVTVDGVVYTISYNGGDGNDVVLTATTVPAAPNTGYELVTNNPAATILITLLVSAGLLYIAGKQYFGNTQK